MRLAEPLLTKSDDALEGGGAASLRPTPLMARWVSEPSKRTPLLNQDAGWRPATSSTSAPASGTSSVPPSFKATKARKSKSFIGTVKNTERFSVHDAGSRTALHPKLEEDSDIQHILQKVASLIYGHVKDGQAPAAGHNGEGAQGEGPPSSPSDDEFDESHFLALRCRCFPRKRRKDPVTLDAVKAFLTDVAQSLYFCKQIIVLAAIYLERLMTHAGTKLSTGNWRSIVIVAMMISSKVWEDVHPWNADFEECMEDVAGMRFQPRALYRLESLYLEKLQWRVFVDGEVYAAYFFALVEDQPVIVGEGSVPARRRRERLMSTPVVLNMEAIREDLMEDVMDLDNMDGHEPDEPDFSSDSLRRESKTTSQFSLGEYNPEDIADSRRQSVRIMHEAWRLDNKNPLVGAFRHAPRALAPSRHIHSSESLLWEHKLAVRTTESLGPRREKGSLATLSGATGTQLASELRKYLGKGGLQQSQADADAAGDLSSLNFG
mmetsp:Transcript_34488/g.78714  ORF Transcript_34488/g.78714 Transcript_34488/m.78714 type:complete len:491 (+) Transcript_34488:50-1522(+)